MTKFLSFLIVFGLSSSLKGAEGNAEWKEEANKDGVSIQSRAREGSPLKEFRAVGIIEAPPAKVFAVIEDTESYPSFMPYTTECRVLKRAKDFTIAYQRLDLPMVNDRDYTLRSEHSKSSGPQGPIYRIHWTPVNEQGPPEKPGVQRVSICEGGWVLEPKGPGATRAVYNIFTDSGGAIPSFIANNGSKIAISKLFAAVRKQVREQKYAAEKSDE